MEESGPSPAPTTAAAENAAFRELAEELERANHTIEILVNRTNTLVRLLDLLSQRVDRLEARA